MIPRSIPRVLIPAAGFGKRVEAREAKEMLPHPVTGRPLITRSLELTLERGWQPLVITRAEKKSLIVFAESFGAEVLVIESSKEWPDTLLKSQKMWHEHNLVLLPDTEFSPAAIMDEALMHLEMGAPAVFATFNVDDGSTWGVLRKEPVGFSICEKPDGAPGLAWGFFGFQKNEGSTLLNSLLQSTFDHRWQPIHPAATLVSLERFVDLTRPLEQSEKI